LANENMKIIIEADLFRRNSIKEPKLIEAYIRYNLKMFNIKNIEIVKEEK